MPIGIIIIVGILAVIVIGVIFSQLSTDQLNTAEVVVYGGCALVICGVLIYIIVLSFTDNAAATKLFKELLEIL